MRKMLIILAALISIALIPMAFTPAAEAASLPIRVSDSYKSGIYYTRLCNALDTYANYSMRERFLQVALSQIGYNSNSNSSNLSGTGDANGYYQEYGYGLGLAYTDWCAEFVSWSAAMAGVPSSIIPRTAGAGTFRSVATAHRLWSDDFSTYVDYKPEPGDIILNMPDGNGAKYNSWTLTAHVAIIAEVGSRASDGGWNIRTVERLNNTVGLRETRSTAYSWNSNGSRVHFYQMIIHPSWPEDAEAEWATIAADQTSVPVGTQVNFTVASNVAQGENGYAYDVYVWDGTSYPSGEGVWVGVSANAASYTFNTAGDYYVRFRVHNTTHDLYSDPVHIQAYAAPTSAVLNADRTEIGCTDTVTFTYSANQPCNFSLHVVGDSVNDDIVLSNNSTTTYTFTAPGTYAVWVAAWNNAASIPSNTLTISVHPYPAKPVVSWSASKNGDALDEFTFTWAPTADTDWYDIRFYNANGENIWTRIQYYRNFFRAYFPAGSYSMDVASVNTHGLWSFSDRVSFTVKSASTPAAGNWVTSREVEHKLFVLCSKKCSWLEAEAIAGYNGGGKLAAITSQAVQDAVADAVAKFGYPVWIGGETFRNSDWRWSNGYAFSYIGYTNWLPGEPQSGLGSENCVEMCADGYWNDIYQSGNSPEEWADVKGYVVQYEPASVNISPIIGTFKEGQNLTKDDLNVTVVFANGTMIETTDYAISQSGTEVGTQTVTVTYGNLTDTSEITLVEVMPEADFILPDSLTVIEAEAFNGLAMTSVRCPEGLEEIGARAFANCPNLRDIYISENVLSIARTAFEGCTDLVIWGRAGSVAQAFANNRGFTFKEYID